MPSPIKERDDEQRARASHTRKADAFADIPPSFAVMKKEKRCPSDSTSFFFCNSYRLPVEPNPPAPRSVS
ncbi:MAG: hypothetical protein IIU73_04205, partial [Selenomonadales bacterium]|nr:hypothetical protein [Selenomonadales bacterium]